MCKKCQQTVVCPLGEQCPNEALALELFGEDIF
jgi:hypothetical protein